MERLVEKDIFKIFDNLINTNNKREILSMIKSDILDSGSEITLLELDFLSENIYDYCCLMVNQITEDTIMWYITRKNAEYYNRVSERDREKFCFKFELKPIQNLIKKYIKILKKQK